MAQFKLQWNNTFVVSNPNAIGQRASYRQKSIGGAFITTGFVPANDLPVSATYTDTPALLDNVIYEFRVQTLCTVSGPTNNDNGLQEALNFACITPAIFKTSTTLQASFNVLGLDITKARFTLRKASDNSIVSGPTIVNPVAGVITFNAAGLTDTTNYYLQIELYTTVQGVEVISSAPAYLGSPCGPYAFTTDAPPICAAVTSVDVDSVEL